MACPVTRFITNQACTGPAGTPESATYECAGSTGPAVISVGKCAQDVIPNLYASMSNISHLVSRLEATNRGLEPPFIVQFSLINVSCPSNIVITCIYHHYSHTYKVSFDYNNSSLVRFFLSLSVYTGTTGYMCIYRNNRTFDFSTLIIGLHALKREIF